MFKYAYILGVLFLSPIFFIIFAKRKDLRTEMLVNGIIGGIIAFATSQFFLGNYWTPVTLFNLKNSIEDFIFGFLLCSESAVIFDYMFRKYYESNSLLKLLKKHSIKIIFSAASVLITFFVFESIAALNSIYNSMLSILIPMIIIWTSNRNLIKVSLLTGIFIFGYTLLFYLVFVALFPGIIETWWNLKSTSGILVLGIPIEELIWFTLVGMFCSVSFKYALGIKYLTK